MDSDLMSAIACDQGIGNCVFDRIGHVFCAQDTAKAEQAGMFT
jgi:hypothetical protein